MKSLILFLVMTPFLAACGDRESREPEEKAQSEHAHAARHGGDLITLGDHEGFLEVLMDHDTGMLSAWVYMGEEMNPASLEPAPVLNLKTDAGPRQITGSWSDGAWEFRDEALRREPELARFRIVVEGKSYSPEWNHQHDDEGEENHDDQEGRDGHEGHDHD